MASLSNIEIVKELRPCIVNGKKALFHTWEQKSEIVETNPILGDYIGGGIISWVAGIIETEDGQVIRVHPSSIRFVDNKIQEYAFDDVGQQSGSFKMRVHNLGETATIETGTAVNTGMELSFNIVSAYDREKTKIYLGVRCDNEKKVILMSKEQAEAIIQGLEMQIDKISGKRPLTDTE